MLEIFLILFAGSVIAQDSVYVSWVSRPCYQYGVGKKNFCEKENVVLGWKSQNYFFFFALISNRLLNIIENISI